MARLPCARRTGLVIEELPDEVLVYDSDRDHALCLNQTAATVWKHCDGKTTPAHMARLIEKEFQTTGGAEVVTLALDQLQKAHLLTGEAPARLSGMSRREVVRRLAASAALPAIAMIEVKPAGTIGSCAPLGNGCTFLSDCCSGCCSSGGTCVPNNDCNPKPS